MSLKRSTNSFGDGLHNVNPQQWVGNYADQLYGFALVRLPNENEARDLVQETFLAALEGLDKFKGESSEQTWLTAILKNKIISFHRLKSNHSQDTVVVGYEEFNEVSGLWNDTYLPREFVTEKTDTLEKKEFQLILQKCMQQLPELWLAAFTMKQLDEEATRVICAQLEITPSNFWVIMHRTKIKLRLCIQKLWI